MVMSPFICGTANFPKEEKLEKPWSSLPSTPRKTSSPKHSFCNKNRNNNNIKDSKNPYSTRGLDKFSALLAELEEKRQRIYSQVDPKDVSFVRFVYSNENDWIPIVVKLKENQIEKEKEKEKKKPNKNREVKHDLEIPDQKVQAEPIGTSAVEEVNKQSKLEPKEVEKRRLKWSGSVLRLQKWRRPSYYLPVAILLILLFLALFGKSFAILCTSLGWYVVPTLTSSDSKRPTKNIKKVYVRRFSENKMAIDGLSSPKNYNPGAAKDKSLPCKHGHQKSW